MKRDAARQSQVRLRLESAGPDLEELLCQIEREPVPERLLLLARQLQAALTERREQIADQEAVESYSGGGSAA